MIICNYYIIMNAMEISDRLIHTAPHSVSLVHYTFRNDGLVSFHKAERTGAGTSLVISLVRYLQLGVANLLYMKIADNHKQ